MASAPSARLSTLKEPCISNCSGFATRLEQLQTRLHGWRIGSRWESDYLELLVVRTFVKAEIGSRSGLTECSHDSYKNSVEPASSSHLPILQNVLVHLKKWMRFHQPIGVVLGDMLTHRATHNHVTRPWTKGDSHPIEHRNRTEHRDFFQTCWHGSVLSLTLDA